MDDGAILDRAALRQLRTEVGGGFARLLAYFREDAVKSVAAVERAARVGNAAAMVLPAHTLKGEALQFGAVPLGTLAEQLETEARRCVECHTAPEGLVADVLQLRPLLERTLAALAREAAPPPSAGQTLRPVFGRRSSAV